MNARLIGLVASFAAITMLIGAQGSYAQELPAPPEPERLPTVTPQARVPVPVPVSDAIANSAALPLDLQQIVDLVHAEIDDSIIARMTNDRGLARPLTVNDLIWLRQNGVSNNLLKDIQLAAPKAARSSLVPSRTFPERAQATAPIVIRTVPSYYYHPAIHYQVAPRYRYHPRHHHAHSHHAHGRGRVSFGISF